MRVLVVDDDPAIRRSLERALSFDGHSVTCVENGAAAISEAIKPDTYDIVVLDLGLPDIDGLDVTRTIRVAGLDLAILVLTARGAVGDRVAGLDAGADDYLAKPFDLNELQSRMRALTRRTQRAQGDEGPEVLTCADLTLEPEAYRCRRGDRDITLTRTEFALLETLMRNTGIVVTRDRLLDRVWGWDGDTLSNSLDVYIGYLRRKLEAEGEPRLLHTVRGVGYVMRERA